MTNPTTPNHTLDVLNIYVQVCENNSSGQPIYIGYSLPGSSKSGAFWCIRKITYDANNGMTDVQFAEGSNAFNKTWDDRATYTYS
jgi:hypothetical protein